MGTNGYSKHIKDIINKTQLVLTTIRRFDSLNTNIKLHLVKACVLPILTYPAYSLNAISKSNLLSLQRKQNKALRFVYSEKYPYTKNTAELHALAKLDPINRTLYARGNQIKHKLINIIKDNTYTNTIQGHEQGREHAWFKKPINTISKEAPRPLYAYTNS